MGRGGRDRRVAPEGMGPDRRRTPAMPYPFPPTVGSASPWGAIQQVTALGSDAVAVSTASHGGLRVSPAALACIPEPLRATPYSGGGWFEEDCDWAIPYLALGLDAFESDPERAVRLRAAARRAVWTYHRDHAGLLGVGAAADGGRSDA